MTSGCACAAMPYFVVTDAFIICAGFKMRLYKLKSFYNLFANSCRMVCVLKMSLIFFFTLLIFSHTDSIGDTG